MSYTTPTAGPKGMVGRRHDFSSLKAAAPSVLNRRSEWIFQQHDILPSLDSVRAACFVVVIHSTRRCSSNQSVEM